MKSKNTRKVKGVEKLHLASKQKTTEKNLLTDADKILFASIINAIVNMPVKKSWKNLWGLIK